MAYDHICLRSQFVYSNGFWAHVKHIHEIKEDWVKFSEKLSTARHKNGLWFYQKGIRGCIDHDA